MSGPLVGLVVHHGPTDPHEYALAVVLAEDMHHARDRARLDTDELVRLTRLGRTSVVAAIKRARADGWLIPIPGRGRGHASTYLVDYAGRFAECSEKCRHATSLVETALGKDVATRHDSTLKVSPRDLKVSPRDNTHVVRKDPSSSAAPSDDALPVVVGVKSRDDDRVDDDTMGIALDGLPIGPTAAARRGVTAAIAAGWTASKLNEHLRGLLGPDVLNRQAVIYDGLKGLPDPPRARPAAEPVGPGCNRCAQPERGHDEYAGNRLDPHPYEPPSTNGHKQERGAFGAAAKRKTEPEPVGVVLTAPSPFDPNFDELMDAYEAARR